MATKSTRGLSRPRIKMAANVRNTLSKAGLLAAYRSRPDYQQNDYLGWIERAVRPETKQKRLDQMLRELKRGGVYMNMKWSPDRTKTGASTRAPAKRAGKKETSPNKKKAAAKKRKAAKKAR